MCKRFTASSFLNLTSRTFDLFRILELSKYLVRKYLHSEMQNVLISEPHDKIKTYETKKAALARIEYANQKGFLINHSFFQICFVALIDDQNCME